MAGTLTQPDLDQLKSQTNARLCNLPRFQPSAIKLMKISADSETALEEFGKLFRADPSLASELLQRANSADLGVRSRIADIKSALLFLGLDRVRNLAFTICMGSYMKKTGRTDTRPIWFHSLATAVIADEVGKACGVFERHLYTAALMHDLGRLGLLLSGGEDYAQMLAGEFQTIEEANELERIRFGMRHADAGWFLARSWGFPDPLCGSIRLHHDTAEGSDKEVLHAVRLSCALAGQLGYPEVKESAPASIGELFPKQVLGLPALGAERLLELVEKSINSL